MKTLSLTVIFDPGEYDDGYYEIGNPYFYWKMVPIGTKKNCTRYEYNNYQDVNGYDNEDLPNTNAVRGFKGVLEAFQLYAQGQERNAVNAIIQQAVNADWSKNFEIDNYDTHGHIYIKYYIDDHTERAPYIFYPTDEQRALIESVKYRVGNDLGDYEKMNSDELNNAILDKLLTVYKDWVLAEYEKEVDEELS